MKYFNRQNFGYRLMLGSILIFLLCCLGPSISIAKKTTAPVMAGFMEINLSPELAEDQGLPREQHGVIIIGVYQGSPAEKAGLREGDVIVQVQDKKKKPVDIADCQQYSNTVDTVPADKPLVLTILREGQRKTCQLLRSSEKFGPVNQPPAAATPQTIKVASDGSGDCKNIYGALLRSCPGDTILIKPGNYGSLTVQRNQITIAAFDPKNPPVFTGVDITALKSVQIKDLIIDSGKPVQLSDITSGVWFGTGAEGSLTDCQIHGFFYGVAGAYGASNNKISHNLISKNGGGIWVPGQVEISNNTIIENRVLGMDFIIRLYKTNYIAGVGIMIAEPGSRGLVFNNIVAYNNIGCLIDPNTQVTLEYNDVFQQNLEQATLKTGWALNDNHATLPACNSNILSQIKHDFQQISGDNIDTYTLVLFFQPSPTNISADPLFADPLKGDYRLANDSPLIEKGRDKNYIGAFPPLTPKQDAETQNKPPLFGISARPLTNLDRQKLGPVSVNGLWVTEVKKDSPAEKLQFKVNDVILEINGFPFKDIEEFKKLIMAAPITTVKVLRDGEEIVLTASTEF